MFSYGISMGDARNQRHLRPFTEQRSPWAYGTKQEKLEYCQRQIERLQRWHAEEPSCPKIKKALSDWIDRKKSVIFGDL